MTVHTVVTPRVDTPHARHIAHEVAWLLSCGESTHQVARAVGYRNAQNLARGLRAWGRDDLADTIQDQT